MNFAMMMVTVPAGMVEAYKTEQVILSSYNEYAYQPKIEFAGQTECFSENPIELDERLKELAEQYSDLG